MAGQLSPPRVAFVVVVVVVREVALTHPSCHELRFRTARRFVRRLSALPPLVDFNETSRVSLIETPLPLLRLEGRRVKTRMP